MLFEDTSKAASHEDEAGTSSDWFSIAERIREIRAGRVLAILGSFVLVNFIPHESDENGNINLSLG